MVTVDHLKTKVAIGLRAQWYESRLLVTSTGQEVKTPTLTDWFALTPYASEIKKTFFHSS